MENKLVMLIVDDVEINRVILRSIFKKEYEIVEADNGVSALKVLEERADISIILLDIMMPKMNGIEFLTIVKKNKEYAKIPVVVNTEQGEEKNELWALDLGADDFVAKPYNPRLVSCRVRNITEKNILERQRIERSLKDTKQQLASLIDTVPGGIGIFTIGPSIGCIYLNDGMFDLLGYKREDVKLSSITNIMSLVHEEDRTNLTKEIYESVRMDKTLNTTFRLARKDGKMIWVSLSATKFKEENGNAIYHGVFLDVTEDIKRQKIMSDTMQELVYRAERDMLTGIYNREKFYAKTEELLKQQPDKTYLLILWNIDRFKVINDLYGSRIGDKVLVQLAGMFRKMLKGIGTYGRLEADHFVLCVPKDFYEANLDIIQKYLQKGVAGVQLGYPVVSHIGIYEISDINMSVDLMCDRANLALGTIKGNYLKRYAFYNDLLRSTLLSEQELIGEMETALIEQQFFIQLQPIFSAETKQPVSAEALVRWRHPLRGIISPGMFIPVFEKNGFISKLDMFVWEEACKLLNKMQKSGKTVLPISINVSRINFYSADLCNTILNLVNRYEIEPYLLKIEITESSYMDNPHQLLAIMERFQKLGFQVLMDDFGSGYSSLNMLKDVMVDYLKIDMKFMDMLETSERAASILIHVINMAKSLNMKVIAEGVETKNQYNFLKKMGCDCIQGYYFSKPLFVEDYIHLVSSVTKDTKARASEIDKKTILVVDDSEIVRKSMVFSLEDEYTIIEAGDGEEALNLLSKNSRTVDLVLTDIRMPVMDGFELLMKIKEDPVLSHIPTIVVTSMDQVEDEIEALKRGALDVIIKPFDPMVMQQRVHNLIRLSEAENIWQKYETMRENEAVNKKIQEIVNHAKAGICLLQVKTNAGAEHLGTMKILYANQAFFKIRGISKVEQKDANALDYIGAGMKLVECNAVTDLFNNGIIEKTTFAKMEYQIRNMDGEVHNIEMTAEFEFAKMECFIYITEIETSESS